MSMNDPAVPLSNRELATIEKWLLLKELATKEDQMEALLGSHMQEVEPACKHCHSRDIERDYGDRKGKCVVCGKVVYVFANTIFERVRNPFAWLLTIRLLGKGISISIQLLSNLAEVAYSTAWVIYHKITNVLANSKTDGTISVGSARFTCIYHRRSRLTPSERHPHSEQEAMEMRFYEEGSASALFEVTLAQLEEEQRRLFLCMPDDPVTSDQLVRSSGLPIHIVLASLTFLELANLIETLPGNLVRKLPLQFVPEETQETGSAEEIERAVDTFSKFVARVHRGISRKYLPHYIGAFRCEIDRTNCSPETLLAACLAHQEMTDLEMRQYVSPLFVPIILPPELASDAA